MMSIYVSGEFSEWTERKQYNLNIYDINEIILDRMEKFLRMETEKAMKDGKLEEAKELLEATISIKDGIIEAKKNAEEQMVKYLKEKEENGDVE